jgi:hypothetical protein
MLLPLPLDAMNAPSAPPASVASAEAAPVAPAKAAPPTGEVQLALGLAGGTSGWSGDPVSYSSLKIGLRLFRIVSPFVQGRLGYGRIDQRMLTFLSAGVEAGGYIQDRFFPKGFVAFVHQHEESMASVDEEPFGALMGIGPGIRHRAGVQLGAGFDVVAVREPRYELTVGPELVTAFLTYSSGPGWYGFVGIVGGGNFHLF